MAGHHATTLGMLLGTALGAGAGCGFEDTKAPAVEQAPIAARWCRPVDGEVAGDGHVARARWETADDVVRVERTLDDVVFEVQTWELGAVANGAPLVRRTIETPAVLGIEDDAWVRAHPIDALQALTDRADPWAAALVGHDDACDVLPSAYGHGYPESEGWYVAGAPAAGAASASGWYGHGGPQAGAPFGPVQSRFIVITYDAAERMVEEWLDRGASDGSGVHDLARTRRFDVDGVLLEDRLERWSPTPKEDVVRTMVFARAQAGVMERALRDTWSATLDRRFIPQPDVSIR